MMKKIFLILSILITVFIYPVKAEGAPYFYALSFVDLTSLGMGNEVGVTAFWRFNDSDNKKLLPLGSGRIINVPQINIDGNVTIELDGGTSVDATFRWYSDYAEISYMGATITVNNWIPYENGQVVDNYVVGNGFEWWSSEPQIDLTITESCLLIILFICAANLICGKE